MTAQEMILRVRQASRQIDSYVRGALFQEEILLQLNIAQDQYQFIKYRNGKSNPKDLVDIRTSEKRESIPVSAKETGISNCSEFELPQDFRFHNTVYVTVPATDFRVVDILPQETCENFIRTVNHIPILRTYKGFIQDGRIIVLHDPFVQSAQQIELNYYKKLAQITDSVDCELPEHVHDVICEIAISRITGRTVPEEYQISSDILNKTE